MRQEIAYGLIALLLVAGAAIWWLKARRLRHGRKGNLRIDLRRKD
jgi:hypothetical protein